MAPGAAASTISSRRLAAWFLIAQATAVVVAGSAVGILETVALAVAFVAVMFVGVRRLLARASLAYDEAGRVPGAWIAAIFAGVLLSAFVTEQIGIAVIFGAFIMGAVMPRHAGLTEDVTHRVEDLSSSSSRWCCSPSPSPASSAARSWRRASRAWAGARPRCSAR